MDTKGTIALAILVLIFACFGAFGQEASSSGYDPLILRLGAEGGPFERLDVGTAGGTVYLAVYGEPSGWNPVVTMESTIRKACGMFLRGLISWHEATGEVYAELARSWEISEDGKQITFYLRRGLTWSDGAPFTADDVLFTFNDVHLNDDVDSSLRSRMRLPNGDFPVIEKVGDHEIRVTVAQTYRLLFDCFGALVLPRHRLARSVHRLNPDAPPGSFNSAWTAGTPPEDLVGLGPFLVERHVPGQQISLRRNPTYHHFDQAGHRLPYIERIVFTICENRDVSYLLFLNGQIDGISVQAQHLPLLRSRASSEGWTVFTGGVAGDTRFLVLNQDTEDEQLRGLFRTLAFRQAVAHAIDRESIIEIGYNGHAVPIWSPVWMRSPYYAGREEYGGPVTERDAVVYEFDLAKASTLLDICGIFDTDGDGLREFEDGSTVSFTLNWPVQSGLHYAPALIIADDLAKIGVRVILDAMNWNSFVDRLTTGNALQAGLIGFTVGMDPGRAAAYRSDGEVHLWHYSAAKGDIYSHEQRIDELLDLAAGTLDVDEAFRYYKEFQILFAQEDLGVIFTLSPGNAFAFRNRFGNARVFGLTESMWGAQVSELIYIKDSMD